MLTSGKAITLSDVADVRLGPKEPASSRMRVNGEISVGLAVVPRKAINLVKFGEDVRRIVSKMVLEFESLSIHEVTFQPARTQVRLSDLSRSLATGMMIVAGVLITVMGLRMGLVVAAVVPLVTLASLAVFAWGGGVLHQISIAAFVLALGMLVDNAIVMAENVQWRLDQGQSRRSAAAGAVAELGKPLAGATATTLAAFVPMLISKGPTADFTRAIPVIIMLTLSVSYLFAIFVTPVLTRMSLKPIPSQADSFKQGIGKRLAGFALQHSKIVVAGALILVIGSITSARRLDQQFFPSSDRNQLVIDLKLAEGSHLDATDRVSRILEASLLSPPRVTKVASFMGRSAPQFYYNITRIPYSPHFAQIIVETRDRQDITPVLAFVEKLAKDKLIGTVLAIFERA
ncbi:MAG: efflux RND transporter permease subunit [Desulfobacterales bacterium]|jgi:multidrug efflux pump subunit AcrB